MSNEYGERDETAAVFDTQPHAQAGHVESGSHPGEGDLMRFHDVYGRA